MAVRFDASGDKLSRSASGLGATSLTVAAWIYIDVDKDYYSTFWSIDNGSSYSQLITNINGVDLYWAQTGGGIDTGVDLALGGWYFVAAVLSSAAGGTGTLYRAAAGATSLTVSGPTGVGFNVADSWTFNVGNGGIDSAEYLNGRVGHVKVWAAALTAAEVNAEWRSFTPVRTTNLWAYYPLSTATDINDASTNGRNLTAAGTLATAAGPPPILTFVGASRLLIDTGSGKAVQTVPVKPPVACTMFAAITIGGDGGGAAVNANPVSDSLGGTWVQVVLSAGTHTFGSGYYVYYGLYRRTQPTDGTSMIVTFTPKVSGASAGGEIALFTSPGTVDVVQFATTSTAIGSSPATVTLTLPSAPSASNTTIASPGAASDAPFRAQAAVSGWTDIYNNKPTAYNVQAGFVKEGNTSTTFTQADIGTGGGSVGGVIAELTQSATLSGTAPTSTVVKAAAFGGYGNQFGRVAAGLTGNISWCAWVKQTTSTATYTDILGTDDGGSNYMVSGAGVTGIAYNRQMTGGDTAFGSNFTIGTWTFIAMSHDTAAADRIYFAPTPSAISGVNASDSASAGLVDTNTFRIADGGFSGGNPWIGSIGLVRIWTAALTQTELAAEMASITPVRTTNLWASYSFLQGPNTFDESGNGRGLAVIGAPTVDSSGPPFTLIGPSGLFVDDFNRANSTATQAAGVGLNGTYLDWDAPAWQIASNKAFRLGASGTDYATFATTLGSPDHYVEADYDTAGASYCVVNLRRPSAANVETGYVGVVDPSGNATIGKVVASTYTPLTATDSSAVTSGRVRLEALGSALTMKINGATVRTVTDTSITSGNYTGFNGSAGAIFDNFAVGVVTAGAPPATMFLAPTRSTVTLA